MWINNKEKFYGKCIKFVKKARIQDGGVQMDKKLKDKSILNFLKKEGFYVVLFVCLCVVAVVAAVTAKNAKTVKEKPQQVVEVNKEKDVKKEEKETLPNAVEANKNTQTKVATEKQKETTQQTKPVVNTNANFTKPVEGVVIREYSEGFVKTELDSEVTHQGIDIQAKEGTPVYAAADGKVKTYGENSFYGKYVVVTHANGIETTYAALKSTNVKDNQVVNTKTKIGEVGDSAIKFQKKEPNPHLWLQVDVNGKPENPLKIFTSYKVSSEKK